MHAVSPFKVYGNGKDGIQPFPAILSSLNKVAVPCEKSHCRIKLEPGALVGLGKKAVYFTAKNGTRSPKDQSGIPWTNKIFVKNVPAVSGPILFLASHMHQLYKLDHSDPQTPLCYDILDGFIS